MNRRAGVLITVGATVAALATGVPSAADAGPVATRSAALKWAGCATEEHPRLECASLQVPLDHDAPQGTKITLALSRIRHTAKTFQGPLLVNPGGPGASGLKTAGFVAASLPAGLAAQYDVIGFDPRGVGRSRPALDCRPGHFAPVRPDSLPRDRRTELANLSRARSFALGCATRHPELLPHVNTVSMAKDLDLVRQALGAARINYLGYSYGTYLGAVYAKYFPGRVRRAVLDSVVDPDAVWYRANLAQNPGFDARHKAFAAWVAKHHTTYRLGSDPAQVEAAWYAMRAALAETPVGGEIGPAELEDTFLPGGYYNGFWPHLADAFSAFARGRDSRPLLEVYRAFAAVDREGDNAYSVYAAVQCRDAAWPRSWETWRLDNRAAHAKAPFSTWNNVWYNAPCLFWPVAPLGPTDVTNDKVPPVLILQATDDAATPYEGAVTVHRKLRGSRLVVERGGGNHATSLSGNACMDRHVTDYLATGKLPPAAPTGEVDASCATGKEPRPLKEGVRTGAPETARAGAAPYRILGHRG